MPFLNFFESYQEIENIRAASLHLALLKIEKSIAAEQISSTYELNKYFIKDCVCKSKSCEWCAIQDKEKIKSQEEKLIYSCDASKEILRKEKKCRKLTKARMMAFYEKLNNYSIKRMKLFEKAGQINIATYDWDQTNKSLFIFEDKICEMMSYNCFFAMINSLEETIESALNYINVKLKYYMACPIIIAKSALNKIIGRGRKAIYSLQKRFEYGYDQSKNAYQHKDSILPTGFAYDKEKGYHQIIDSHEKKHRIMRENRATKILLDEFDKIPEEEITIAKPQTQGVKFDKNNIVKMNKTIVDFITQWKQVSEVDSLSDLISSDIGAPFMNGGVDISMLSTT